MTLTPLFAPITRARQTIAASGSESTSAARQGAELKNIAARLANYRQAGRWEAAVSEANRYRRLAEAAYFRGQHAEAARWYMRAADAIEKAPAAAGDKAGDPATGKLVDALEYRESCVRELRVLAWGAERGHLTR